jgi:hypothetical protein
MAASNTDIVLIDYSASNFAFRASQLFERVLLERSIELASQCGASLVTTEHIKACFDQSVFDQILKKLVGETINDVATGESGRDIIQSREAA